jgi:excisionase family DNA binding protein
MVSRREPASKSSSYLLPSEVAEVLQVSPKTVTRWAKEGKLASRRTLGGHRRYTRADIESLAERLQEQIPA